MNFSETAIKQDTTVWDSVSTFVSVIFVTRCRNVSASLSATKLNIFDKTYGHFPACLWQQSQIFLTRYLDISGLVTDNDAGCFWQDVGTFSSLFVAQKKKKRFRRFRIDIQIFSSCAWTNKTKPAMTTQLSRVCDDRSRDNLTFLESFSNLLTKCPLCQEPRQFLTSTLGIMENIIKQ